METTVKTINITVEGGVIQHVEVPAGVRVVVRDYDVDCVELHRLQRDQDGHAFVEQIWNHQSAQNFDA